MEEKLLAATIRAWGKLRDQEIIDWANKIKHNKRMDKNRLREVKELTNLRIRYTKRRDLGSR